MMQLADGKIIGGLREANIHEVIRQVGGQIVAPEPAEREYPGAPGPAPTCLRRRSAGLCD